MTTDSAGILYVADTDNQAIRQWAAPPPLQISNSGSQVVLTWPALAFGFVLQRGGAVADQGAWTDLANGMAVSGMNKVLTDDLSAGAACFYRLRKP